MRNPTFATLKCGLVVAVTLTLAACNTTASTTPSALQQAAQDVKNLTPEQKYAIACQSVDALHLAYVAFVSEKQSANTNARVEAAYAAVQPICAAKPENYATALIAVVQAVNAFKAALPKAA